MRFTQVLLIFVAIIFGWLQPVEAQRRPMAEDEYIRSSSPLKTGGTISSLTTKDREKMIEIANLPIRSSRPSVIEDSNRSTEDNHQLTRRTAQRPAQNVGYPYPDRTIAVGSSTNRFYDQNVRPTAFQAVASTTNPVLTAQNCNCGPAGGFQVPAATVPQITLQQPAIQVAPQSVPQGQLVVPGTTISGQTINPQTVQLNSPDYCQQQCAPNVGYAQNSYGFGQPSQGIVAGFGNGWFRNWWRPLVTGNGAYQPILDFGGLRQGTYIGKGVIGQPKAYVTNQPVRNLLRYLFP